MPTIFFSIEIVASLLGVAYILLIARKNMLGWLAGIVSCLIFSVICFNSGLKSQGTIQIINVLMGVWGWVQWRKKVVPVKSFPLLNTVVLTLLPLIYISFNLLNPSLNWTSKLDQIALIYSMVATIFTIRMIHQNWLLWLIVNGITVITAFSNQLYFYAGLSVIYFGLSLYGMYIWRK